MTLEQDAVPQPVRVLLESVPHRTVGGIHINSLTPYPAEYESYNEKHAIYALAMCQDVAEIRSQPRKISYIKESGKVGYHIPDFEVHLTSGEIVYVEVKALENLLQKSNCEKYSLIARHYRRENLRLEFLVNAQIEVQPLFGSILLLFRYLKSDPLGDSILKVKTILANGPMAISNLIDNSGFNLRDIYILLAKRIITFDIDTPLSIDSLVSLPDQPFKGLNFEKLTCSTRYRSLLEELAMGRQPTDQFLISSAKNWRQLHNALTVWAMVGGYSEKEPIRDVNEIGFLRSAYARRSYAPGLLNSKTIKT